MKKSNGGILSPISSIEVAVVEKLKTAQYLLCTVESCTGGMISHLITNVSGASEVFWGSHVVYDNSAKQILGVSTDTLNKTGAVSAQTAQELAESGLLRMQTALSKFGSVSLLKPQGLACLSITGIAGPSGGSPEKPVGLCFMGLAISNRKTLVQEFRGNPGSIRSELKLNFAHQALELLRSSF